MNYCKNCIRFDECKDYTEPNECYPEVGGCPAFKSRYAELPCNVGDTVYAAITPIDECDIRTEPCIDEWKVCGLLFKNDKWYAENLDGEFFEIGTDLCKLTREEAERELERVDMSELNREEIIKALERCSHDECLERKCPYYKIQTPCLSALHKDTLALIKKLIEENKR